MPPQSVVKLKSQITKLEKDLYEANQYAAELLQRVNDLTKVVQRQEKLLKKNKLCLVPTVHLEQLEEIVPSGSDPFGQKSPAPPRKRKYKRKKSYFEIIDSEEYIEPKSFIKQEEDVQNANLDDEDHIPPSEDELSQSSNFSNPSSPVGIHLEEKDDKNNRINYAQNTKAARRSRNSRLKSRSSNFSIIRRKQKGVLGREGSGANSVKRKEFHRPLTDLEESIVNAIDQIAKIPYVQRRQTNAVDPGLIVPSGPLESFERCLSKRIEEIMQDVLKESGNLDKNVENTERANEAKVVPKLVMKKVQNFERADFIVADAEVEERVRKPGKSQSESKPEFECSVCKKMLRSAVTLKAHMSEHEGNKPFTCYICGKSFAVRGTLTRHLLIHGEKKQKCSQCEKCFTAKEDLKRHERFVHTKECRYQCPMCPKQFVDSSGFRRHERVHLGIKRHLCSECGRSFPEVHNLRLHMNSQHSGIDNPFKVKLII